jgi:hypothetical protein
VAGSAFASTALSYDRILGANDRIALGHIGVGHRGSGLHMMVSQLKDKYNDGPRWRGRPEVKQVREQYVDWKKWLMTKPYRPFDLKLYFECLSAWWCLRLARRP